MNRFFLIVLLLLAAQLEIHGVESSFLQKAFRNASFEEDALGYKGCPSGWNWLKDAEKYIEITEQVPIEESGGKSLKIDYHGNRLGKGDWYIWTPPIPIDSRESYMQSCWIKTDGLVKGFGASFGMIFLDDKMTPLTSGLASSVRLPVRNVGPVEWEYFAIKLIPSDNKNTDFGRNVCIPANAKYLIMAAGASGYPGKLWLDGFRFEIFRETSGHINIGDNKTVFPEEIKAPIVIDGKLDENIWTEPKGWQADFRTTVCPVNKIKKVKEKTSFKIAYDKENVYIAVECSESNPDIMQTSNMSIWDDDAIELFLDPSGQKQMYWHFAVTPAGRKDEFWLSKQFNARAEYAAGKNSHGYTVEIRIPKTSLWQMYNEAGSSVNNNCWAVNVARHRPKSADECFTSWSYTGEGGFHNPANMGLIIWGSYKNVLSDICEIRLAEINKKIESEKDIFTDSKMGKPVIFNEICNQIFQIRSSLLSISGFLNKSQDMSLPDFAIIYREILSSEKLFNEKLRKLKNISLNLPNNRIRLGYAVYSTPLLERPDPSRIPAKSEFIDKLILRAALNEIASGTFSIFTKKKLEGVELTGSDLKNGENIIKSENIDIRIIHTWGKNKEADIMATDLRIPLTGWLENYDSLPRHIPEIAENNSTRLWINIKIPENTPSGSYSGIIKIKAANNEGLDLPLTLDVLPFKLEDTDLDLGLYYHGVLKYPGQPDLGTPGAVFYGGLTTEESMTQEFKLMVENGFNFVMLCNYAQGPHNPGYTEKLFKAANNAGIRKICLMGAEHIINKGKWKSPEDMRELARRKAMLKEKASKIIAMTGKYKIAELWFYAVDEPSKADDIERFKIIADTIHSVGGKTMAAIIFDEIRKPLINYLDYPFMSWASVTSGNSDIFRIITERGGNPHVKTGYYANIDTNYTDVVRLCFGWYLKKSNFSGNIPWALYYLGKDWLPFREKGYYSAVEFYVFPTKDRPVPTLKFHAAAEGIKDLKYIETLQKLIANASNKPETYKANETLKKIMDNIPLKNQKGVFSDNYKRPAVQYDTYRKELQDAILEIIKSKSN